MLLNASSFYVSLSPKTLKHNMSTRLRALSKATDSKGNPVSRSYPCVDQVSRWFEGTLVSGFYPNRNSRFYLFFVLFPTRNVMLTSVLHVKVSGGGPDPVYKKPQQALWELIFLFFFYVLFYIR